MVFVWVLVPAFLIAVVVWFVSYRNRKPNSLEAGLRDFRRGLDALDPANDPLKRRSDARGVSGADALDDPNPNNRR